MRMYPSRILCHAMALIVLLLVCAGCVKRMSAASEPGTGQVPGLATLRAVTVSDDASRIEVTSDKPFTYTSYKAGEPAKIVVDLSQTDPGQLASPIPVGRGNLRSIALVRQPVGAGMLTRLEVALVKDADFAVATDPADKKRLLIYLANSEPEAKPATPEHKEPPLAEARIEEKTLTPEPVAVAAAPGAEVPVAPPADTKSAAKMEMPAEPKAEPKAEAKADPVQDPAPAAAPAAPAAAPVAGEGRRLTAVSAAPDGVDLTVAGGVLTFNSFKLSKPDRIVIDLFGMKNAVPQKVVPIDTMGVANARIGSTPDKVRIVLDSLHEPMPGFDVEKTEQGLKIRLKPAGSAPAAAGKSAADVPVKPAAAPVVAAAPLLEPSRPLEVPEAKQATPVVSTPEPAASQPVRTVAAAATEVSPAPGVKGALESLDFKVVDGFSRITLKLYGTCAPGKPVRGVQGLSLSIDNCQVPKRLQRALDTSQFGSPVLSVTPYQAKVKGVNVAKLLVRLKGSPAFTLQREGDLLVWDITNPGPLPAVKLPAAPAGGVAATKAAARAKEAAEPRVAEELAPQPSRSDEMVTEIPSIQHSSRKVYKGRRVTLEFSDADVRKIFQLIAEVSNLNFLIADDVTGTISIKLVNVPWDQALDVILDAKGLGMQRDGNIVQIKPKSKIQSQADEDMAAKKAAERAMELRTAVFEVNYASTADVVSQFNALKSERGTITRDERTSRVIVKDIQTALDEMRLLLRTLDMPEKQVMIEARIVEASSNFTRDLGVQWGLHYKDGSASLLGVNQVDTGFGGVVSPSGPGSTGAGGIGMGMSFGKLTSNIQLDMRLSAAATIGQVKIISTPKVVTLNNKAAKISQGQSIPYQSTSAEGTKTEFVEAALTLEVTPHITADGSVSMKIKASNNSPGSGTPPPINKKEATTELVVSNGETTVIGGIYVDSDTETDTGVPFLADIPLLGWLFKSNSKTKTKTELLIFITPKLLN
jgi:type IV pilus assembly protein PilQ